MDLNSLIHLGVLLIAIVGGFVRLEHRLTRIETNLERCPHIDEKKGPLVPTKTTF